MMQKKLFISSVFILSLLSLNLFAKDQGVEREKKINKSFTVAVGDKLNIENEFGQVTVNTWDKNEIAVEIVVKSNTKSEEKSEELINAVTISETKSGGAIYLKTIIRSSIARSGKQTLSVNYNITMPASLALSVVNKFGNIYLPSMSNSLQIKVSYGNLKAVKLTGSQDKRIEVSFGNANIDEIDNAFIESKYSKLHIDKIGKAEIQNSFGKTDILEANTLRITQKYGDLDLRKVNSLTGSVEFSNIDLDYVGKSVDLNLKYSGNADLGTISSSVELLKINAGFSTVYIKFDETANMDFEAHLKYGDIKLNNQMMKDYVKNTNQGSSTYDYKGKIGKGGGGNMMISSQYTTIYLQ